MLLPVSSFILRCAFACVEFHVEGENFLFGMILFSRSVTRTSAFLVSFTVCRLIVGFIHCMSLDRSLRTRRINLIESSLGHIKGLNNS